MEMKIIPFCLETAKKIQAGEIKGAIKTKNKLVCKITSYCNGTDFFVERTTEIGGIKWCYPYTKEGKFIDGMYNGGTDYDLILEIPDNKENISKLRNNFTTPEESDKLLELGVPLLSADMYYAKYSDGGYAPIPGVIVDGISEKEYILRNNIPCWSTGRLLEISEMCSSIKYFPYAWRIETIITDFSLRKFDFSKLEGKL